MEHVPTIRHNHKFVYKFFFHSSHYVNMSANKTITYIHILFTWHAHRNVSVYFLPSTAPCLTIKKQKFVPQSTNDLHQWWSKRKKDTHIISAFFSTYNRELIWIKHHASYIIYEYIFLRMNTSWTERCDTTSHESQNKNLYVEQLFNIHN